MTHIRHSYESYIEHLSNLPEEYYKNKAKRLEKTQVQRDKNKKYFPHVVTFEADYYSLDYMDNWCRDSFGDKHGKCDWEQCPLGYDYWYEIKGFDSELEKLLKPHRIYHDSDFTDEEKKRKQKITHIIINEFHDNVSNLLEAPGEHCHKGIWKTYFLEKTGYDYGFCDYYFKNEEDAVYFKIMWSESNTKKIY